MTTDTKQYPVATANDDGSITVQYSDNVCSFEGHSDITFIFRNEDIKIRIQKPDVELDELSMYISSPHFNLECNHFDFGISSSGAHLQSNYYFLKTLIPLGAENIKHLTSHPCGRMAIDTLNYTKSVQNFTELTDSISYLKKDEDSYVMAQKESNLKFKLKMKLDEIVSKCVGNNTMIEEWHWYTKLQSLLEDCKSLSEFKDHLQYR